MSNNLSVPTQEEVDIFFEHFIEHGFFHGDQSRIHEKQFIKLSTFFNNAFRRKGYRGGDLELGSTYDHDWGTVVWYSNPDYDYDEISQKIDIYIQGMINK